MLNEFVTFTNYLLNAISTFLTTEPIKYILYTVLIVMIIGVVSRIIHINN